MQEANELKLLQWMETIGEHTGRIGALADDVGEVKAHLAKLNGSVAKHEKALAEGMAWQKAHNADHADAHEDRIASADRRVEWVKAFAPPLISAFVAILITSFPLHQPASAQTVSWPIYAAPSGATVTPAAAEDLRGGGGAPVFASPTAIVPRGIIEATSAAPPIAPHWSANNFVEAYYTPKGRMNIRESASSSGRWLGFLGGGVRTRVYLEWYHYPDGEAWLCLDFSTVAGTIDGSDCHRMVAYRIKGVEYGILEILRP
jgi:hypothetical protein